MTTSPFHRPTAPTLLGTRRDGRPFYAIMGASEGGQEQPTAAEAATQAAAASAAQANGSHAAEVGAELGEVLDADAAQPADVLAGKYTKAQLAAYALKLRSQAGDARVQAKATAAEEATAALTQKLAQALGLVQGEETTDPAKLTADLQAERAGRRDADLELEVFRTAALHGGDAAKLVDSRTFLNSVRELDTAEAGFRDKVVAAAKAAVAANATLGAVRVAAVGGATFTGGPGEGRDPSNVQPGVDRMKYAYESTGR